MGISDPYPDQEKAQHRMRYALILDMGQQIHGSYP
jgi:hypothetical protein